jgi:hypothetical protein
MWGIDQANLVLFAISGIGVVAYILLRAAILFVMRVYGRKADEQIIYRFVP